MKFAADAAPRLGQAVDRLREAVACWSGRALRAVSVPDDVLTSRSRLLGLPPPGQVSANGTCRLLRCRDAWLAVSLPRAEDIELVPALTSCDAHDDRWECVTHYLMSHEAEQVLERAHMLGLPITRVGERLHALPGDPSMHSFERCDAAGARRTGAPRVLDLSALWAGPLCGALLADAGCDVVKIEHIGRRDTTYTRSPDFDRLLNGRKRREVLDFGTAEGKAALAGHVRTADVVITSSRPRTFDALGLGSVPDGCVWIAITAHGLQPRHAVRVGFGDDCAAAGGLVGIASTGAPTFLGDALADPLAGLFAAATALRFLALGESGRYDISLAACAAAVARFIGRYDR